MSDAKYKRVELWDGIITYDEPPPDVRAESVKAAIELGLNAFDRHKKSLMGSLREACSEGPKSKPFDADGSWRRLTFVAGHYFWRTRVMKDVMPAAARARLRKCAAALAKARVVFDKTINTDAQGYLYMAWWEGTREYVAGQFADAGYIERKFKRVAAVLAVLEAAAVRGERAIPHMKDGKPPVLSEDDIETLAGLYLNATGSIPGAGDGPFAKFVKQFVIAIGRYSEAKRTVGKITYLGIVDAIKNSRTWSLKDSKRVDRGRSPFSERS